LSVTELSNIVEVLKSAFS